jgi:DNA repair exonuclease SbcCD ATPase subunit
VEERNVGTERLPADAPLADPYAELRHQRTDLLKLIGELQGNNKQEKKDITEAFEEQIRKLKDKSKSKVLKQKKKREEAVNQLKNEMDELKSEYLEEMEQIHSECGQDRANQKEDLDDLRSVHRKELDEERAKHKKEMGDKERAWKDLEAEQEERIAAIETKHKATSAKTIDGYESRLRSLVEQMSRLKQKRKDRNVQRTN